MAQAFEVMENGIKARDILVHVRLNTKAEEALSDLTEWLTTLICKEYPPQMECDADCAVVSGTLHNDYADCETGDVLNDILLLCHRCWGPHSNDILNNSLTDETGLLAAPHSALDITWPLEFDSGISF